MVEKNFWLVRISKKYVFWDTLLWRALSHNNIHRSRVNFRTSFFAVSCWTFLDFFGKSNKFSKGSKQRRIL